MAHGTPGIMVKVARLNRGVEEVFLNGGEITVNDALEAAGFTLERSEELRMRGEKVDLATRLQDGDVVTLIPQIKGG